VFYNAISPIRLDFEYGLQRWNQISDITSFTVLTRNILELLCEIRDRFLLAAVCFVSVVVMVAPI
jgi:hypothetical protein